MWETLEMCYRILVRNDLLEGHGRVIVKLVRIWAEFCWFGFMSRKLL